MLNFWAYHVDRPGHAPRALLPVADRTSPLFTPHAMTSDEDVMTRYLPLFALSLLATGANAHPGHDAADGIGHWVSDMSHGAVVLGVAALVAAVIGGRVGLRRLGKRRN